MRDKRFVAEHRGGLLTLEDHRCLMKWALAMTEHLQAHLLHPVDPLLFNALTVGRLWSEGLVATGEAIKWSRAVHKYAQTVEDPASKIFCRAAGHAVATAHMADHCLGPVYYGRKLMNLLALDAEQELAWQTAKLREVCPNLYPFILQVMQEKLQSRK
ncbi:MAG: hypothetical protein EOM32_08275 [Spirochaetia bacterium]|nr:hypothetical protein [Spirochaetia bacterium]